MKTIALVLCLVMLSGCTALKERLAARHANTNPNASFVDPSISNGDVDTIAMDMAQFLGTRLPPAKTTVVVESFRNAFYARFREQLTVRGFGFVEGSQHSTDAVLLRYRVTPLDLGFLVRMEYNGLVASRFYRRANDGNLALNSKYSIREATN